MTPQEYRRRVSHNSQTVREAIRRGKRLTWVLDKIYTWNSSPEDQNHSVEVCRKIDDIFPSLILGHLAILDTSGADGYRLDAGDKFTHVEYKHSLFDTSRIDVGPKGGLRLINGGKSKATGITSAITAVYSIHSKEIVASKARDTYFLLTNKSEHDWHIIDMRMLSSEKIVPLLEVRTGVSRTISLAVFLNDGEETTIHPDFDKETWEKFSQKVKTAAGHGPSFEKIFFNAEKAV